MQRTNHALELADGASGLDAARAIGPKLAEQAVLVRANGAVQDLRAPLEQLTIFVIEPDFGGGNATLGDEEAEKPGCILVHPHPATRWH